MTYGNASADRRDAAGDQYIDNTPGPGWQATGTGDTDWQQVGGASAGVPIVRAFPFAYNDVGLDTGLALYTPTVGDVLLDAWIEIDTGFNGITPLGDFGTFVGGGGEGLLANLFLGAADMTQTDYDLSAANDGLLFGVQFPNPTSLSAGSATVAGSRTTSAWRWQMKFTQTNPIYIVVSVDGTVGTTPSSFDSATPPPVLPYLARRRSSCWCRRTQRTARRHRSRRW